MAAEVKVAWAQVRCRSEHCELTPALSGPRGLLAVAVVMDGGHVNVSRTGMVGTAWLCRLAASRERPTRSCGLVPSQQHLPWLSTPPAPRMLMRRGAEKEVCNVGHCSICASCAHARQRWGHAVRNARVIGRRAHAIAMTVVCGAARAKATPAPGRGLRSFWASPGPRFRLC